MSSDIEQYKELGYVVVPGLISPELLSTLKEASDRVVSRTRAGAWPHRRTVGKQFPPFDNNDPDSWGVQHLMHPDLGEPNFVELYTSDMFIGKVCELMNCGEDQLQMELLNLLINPLSHDFALRWHRDDVRETATEYEEREALSIWTHGVQWNTALYDDPCLYVVPGSHKVPRTLEQRARSSTMEPPKDPMEMPDAIRINLAAGNTVFYNNNILHCATYDHKQQRATLHGCIGEISGGSIRARNILQHGLNWMKEDRFKDGLDGRARMMLDRLIEMQEATGSNISYSQVG